MLEEANVKVVATSEGVAEISLKNPEFVPKTIFEKNVSPGLQK